VFNFIGVVFSAILYGLYCLVLGLYWRNQLKKPDPWKSVLPYVLTANFILCTAYFITNTIGVQFFIALDVFVFVGPQLFFSSLWLTIAGNAFYITVDLISQLILFHRCWIMWRQPLVMVFPSIVLLAFLVTSWTLLGSEIHSIAAEVQFPAWNTPVSIATFFISLGANALVTGLMMYKIITASNNARGFKTQAAGANGTGQHQRHLLMPILIDSGLIIFVGQLVQSIMFVAANDAFPLVAGSVVMLYGILTTVRVETGAVSHHRKAVNSVDSGRSDSGGPIQLSSFASTLKVNPDTDAESLYDGRSERKVAFPI
jgi:hypothetical protein